MLHINSRKNNKLIETALHINEAEELVHISENLFKEKISSLEKEMQLTHSLYEVHNIKQKAHQVYEDYKKSLEEIQAFVRDTCRGR